jgi:ribosome-associated translation inhibitor RaiA
MRIEVRNTEREEEGLGGYAARRTLFAVSRFSPRIDLVAVRLADTNGPRGGVDKECRIVVRLRPHGRLRVIERDASMHAAIARAADRLARAVAREIARRREPRHPLLRAFVS